MDEVYSENERAWIATLLYYPLYEWETRIIRLHAGKPEQELVADLLTAVVTDARGLGIPSEGCRTSYEALSYTWGKPVFTNSIRLGGFPWSITQNLYHALQNVRLAHASRYLWVDALCIDQGNLDEKTNQIGNMINIFHKAERVVVWLGQESMHTRLAASCLEDFAVNYETRETELRDKPQCESARRGSDTAERDLSLLPIDAHSSLKEFCLGLEDIMQREWLRRAWIVQEVYAARTITVACGSVIISWKALLLTWRALKAAVRAGVSQNRLDEDLQEKSWGPMVLRDGKGFSLEEKVFEHLKEHGLHGRSDLHAAERNSETRSRIRPEETECRRLFCILADSQHLAATDDRDRIYALLNLAGNPLGTAGKVEVDDGAMLRVDYKISTAAVYTNFMNYLVNRSRSLRSLYDICSRTTSSSSARDILFDNLPSFVPDWRFFSVSVNTAAKGGDTFNSEQHYFEAERRECALWEPQISNIWRLPGSLLATVACRARPGPRPVMSRMHSFFWRHKAGILVPGNNIVDGAMSDSMIAMLQRTRLSSVKDDNRPHSPQRHPHYVQVEVALDSGDWKHVFDGNDRALVESIPVGRTSTLDEFLSINGLSVGDLSHIRWQVPPGTEAKDVVVRVIGGFYPLVLRPRPRVGFTYVGYARPIVILDQANQEHAVDMGHTRTVLEAMQALVEAEGGSTFRQELFEIH